MVNVFLHYLDDNDTGDFDNLSDDRYLLWWKKAKSMSLSDYVLVYNYKKDLLLETNIVEEDIIPQKDENNEFVEYGHKKYYFKRSKGNDEFLAFKILNQQLLAPGHDFRAGGQNNITLLTQEKDTDFKKNKLPKLLQILHEEEIIKLLNRYVNNTILNSIISALHVLKEATIQEIFVEIDRAKTYKFGAEITQDDIRNELEMHCKDSNRSDRSENLLFYKTDSKYGLISNIMSESNSNKLLNLKKQIILYGPPGTGKTYLTKTIALNCILDEEM